MTHRIARLTVVCAAAALTLAPIGSTASAASSKAPVYTQKASGTGVTVSHGDKFKVRLKGCVSCGTSWSFAQRPDKAVVKLVKTAHHSTAPAGAVGGYDVTIWTFKAVSAGTTTIKLAEHDAKKNDKVIKRFRLIVEVGQAVGLPLS
jgi:predicted secreted protein